ncbi:MAG: divalent cation tolerance protein CutA [Candidatus Omnitrophica bacterium]|nr:divalent cation tolerance protein CutA [Candidatus Omnitrophota bacterium]
MTEYIVVFVTCGSKKEATVIAKKLLSEKLIACANITTDVKSLFWWKGKLDSARESLITMKTLKVNFSKVEKRVRQLHSYEVAEIIAVPIISGSRDYLKWIKGSVFFILCVLCCLIVPSEAQEMKTKKEIALPLPDLKGEMSVEESISGRRSVRAFKLQDLTPEEVSQLLWACQGITDKETGHRAAPSAGALYPLEAYVVKMDGIFHYNVENHSLEPVIEKDERKALVGAAWNQGFIEGAPMTVVLCAIRSRVTSRYGAKADMYINMEAGHAAQNLHLQAVALGLASVPVGAFDVDAIRKILDLPEDYEPVYLIPVGYPRQ